MNRVQDRIDKIQTKIDSGEIPLSRITELDKGLSTEWKDLVEYQNLQAQAHAMGKLTTEEAQLIYSLLGRENPTARKWDLLKVSQKAAITQVMSELLDWRLKQQGSAFKSEYKAFQAKDKKSSRKSKSDTGLGTTRR